MFAEEMSEPASAPPRLQVESPGSYPLVSASTALPREQGLRPTEGEGSSQLGQCCPGSSARWTLSCGRKAEGGGQSALGMGPRGAWAGHEAGAGGTSLKILIVGYTFRKHSKTSYCYIVVLHIP